VKKSTRLTSEERCDSILKSARTVFSERGFHGTTTRELAVAAGISEALLFKHFPTKEAIYDAMLADCKKSQLGQEFQRLLDLKPSTATLILMVHHIIAKNIGATAEWAAVTRLFMRSLNEDGSFARVVFKHISEGWLVKMRECLKAASASGELVLAPGSRDTSAWFCQHLGLLLFLIHQHETAVLRYGPSRSELIEQAVLFVLRGMGVKERAIKQHYDPAALEMLMS